MPESNGYHYIPDDPLDEVRSKLANAQAEMDNMVARAYVRMALLQIQQFNNPETSYKGFAFFDVEYPDDFIDDLLNNANG